MSDGAQALGEALIDCTRYDELDEVKELVLVQRANVNYGDETQKTALHCAAANGSVALCEFLLANGALQTPNEAGNTPLHWAALNGHGEIVKMLLAHGANVEARNAAGDTPMSMARRGQFDDVGIFLADAMMQVEKARKKAATVAAGAATGGAASADAGGAAVAAGDDGDDEDGDGDVLDDTVELTGDADAAPEEESKQNKQ